MPGDLALLSATELLASYRRGVASPVEAVAAVLARIAACNPTLNAYCLVDEERSLEAARASQARWHRGEPCGLLDGVPVSVKDVLLTKGWPTLKGSRTIARDQRWDVDAPSVARLREHGAVLIGKTTTSEYHWKTVTDSPLTGVTRNPWDPSLTPGGSCGGAAAAVASGLGPLAVGTDGGGSIRVPASFCGIFGLKPTFGRVPIFPGHSAAGLAHVGPMTRTVEDAALLLTVMSGADARDWHALPREERDYRQSLDEGVRGLRVGYSADLGYVTVDAQVAGLVARAVEALAALGARVEPVSPGFSDPKQVFERHWYAELAEIVRPIPPRMRSQMDPGLLAVADEAGGYTLAEYLAAVRQRERLGECMQAFHRRYDLLVTPTVPIAAFQAGMDVPAATAYHRWVDWAPFSFPFNLSRQPAATIPCGFTAAGLPVGVQIVGPLYREDLVLRACRALESVYPPRLAAAGDS